MPPKHEEWHNAHGEYPAFQTWTGVTGSLASYKGVWHFNQNPTSSSLINSINGADALTTTGSVIQHANAVIGNGINLTNGAAYKTALSSFPANNAHQSISIWAYYTSTPSGTANLLSLQNAASSGSVQIGSKSNAIASWTMAQGSPLVSYGTLPASGTWHHYAYTWDGTTNRLYIDGTQVSSASSPVPSAVTPNAIVFGSYLNASNVVSGDYFNGSLDEAELIDEVLSADWIKASYMIQANPANYTINGNVEPIYAKANLYGGALSYVWTGAVSTDPANKLNWTCATTGINNQLPDNSGYATLVIPAGLSNYPVLTDSLSAYGLTIASGASLSLNGFALKVKCNFYNNGALLYNTNNNSKLTFNGALAEQLYVGNTTNAQTGLLEIANTVGNVSLSGGKIDVYNRVNVTTNALNSNGYLCLKAGASTFASVGSMSGSAAINGNVNVEVYFTGGSAVMRGTRAFASPINENLSTQKTYRQLQNYMIITGSGGASNGFDPGGGLRPNAATLTRYYEPAKNAQTQFSEVTNIAEPLQPGYGVFIFYRGNRDGYSTSNPTASSKITAPFAVPENTVVTMVGPINQGDISVPLSFTDNSGEASMNGYNLIGNPYPSTIYWPGVLKTSSVNAELKIARPKGGFATYQSGVSVNADDMDLRYIHPGQAFYVKATAAGQSVTFRERDKTMAYAPLKLLTTRDKSKLLVASVGETAAVLANAPVVKQLRMKLQDASNSDEAVVVFSDSYSSKYAAEDAVFFAGNTVSLSTISSDNIKLVINGLPPIATSTEIPLFVSATSSGNVSLNFTNLSAVDGMTLWLADNYLGTYTEITSKTNAYSFNINRSDAASFGETRLKLVVSPPAVLPVQLSAFKALVQKQAIYLTWTSLNEIDANYYLLERSADGTNYTQVATINAIGNGNAKQQYAFADNHPVDGWNYYRLSLIDRQNARLFTTQANARLSLANADEFLLYPNPVADYLFVKLLKGSSSGILKIYETKGTLIRQHKFAETGEIKLDLSDLPIATYMLQLENSNGKVLQSTKFIKK